MTVLSYESNSCIQVFLSELDNTSEDELDSEVTVLSVRTLRSKFIVLAQVDGVTTKKEYLKEEVDLYQPIAGCIGNCDFVGPFGTLCDQPECVDSGHLYVQNLPYIESIIK